MGRLRPGPEGSSGWCITPGQDVLDRLGLLLYRRELLGKALDGVAEQPRLGDGGVEKAFLVDVSHLCQVEPEMALLDHHGGHCLPEGLRCNFRRSSRLFECLCLVNLQDSHGVQGRGHEGGCQLTGFGREMRTVPPSGGVSQAQVHRDRSLHLGNARVPPGSPAVESSEDGGDGRAASGRERGHPRLRQLLMHLRKKGTGAECGFELRPDIHGCPVKHCRQHGRNGILKKTRSSVICSFRICSFS